MLIDEIREVLGRGGGTSFAELAELEGFSGDLAMCSGKSENVLFWAEMSPAAVDAVNQILKEGEYEMVPTTFMVYLVDGRALSLPLVKSNRQYRKPHWLPVVFNKKNKSKRGKLP